MPVSNRRNHGSRVVSIRVLQHNRPESRHQGEPAGPARDAGAKLACVARLGILFEPIILWEKVMAKKRKVKKSGNAPGRKKKRAVKKSVLARAKKSLSNAVD